MQPTSFELEVNQVLHLLLMRPFQGLLLKHKCMNGKWRHWWHPVWTATTRQLLAYGQTGSGKTHTMMGPSSSVALHNDLTAGVIPRAMRDLFAQTRKGSTSNARNKENCT